MEVYHSCALMRLVVGRRGWVTARRKGRDRSLFLHLGLKESLFPESKWCGVRNILSLGTQGRSCVDLEQIWAFSILKGSNAWGGSVTESSSVKVIQLANPDEVNSDSPDSISFQSPFKPKCGGKKPLEQCFPAYTPFLFLGHHYNWILR